MMALRSVFKRAHKSLFSSASHCCTVTRNASYTPFNTSSLPNLSWDGDLSLQSLDVEPFRAPPDIQLKCHWVIPNRFMTGKSPNNDQELMHVLTNDLGINTFVNLTDKAIDEEKRSAHIEYIHFPIRNFQVGDDANTIQLMRNIMDRLNGTDCKIYSHCNSGHGRAGVIAALCLQCVYGMDEAMSRAYLKLVHTTRCNNNIACNLPEKEAQVNQVKRLNESMLKLYHQYSEA